MNLKPIVIAIRDERGGVHKTRVQPGESQRIGVLALINNVYAAGREPMVTLTCIPGGKQ